MATLAVVKLAWESLTRRFRWFVDKHDIFAIHASDIETVDVEVLKCASCGQCIDVESLGGWVKSDDQLKPFCTDMCCNPLKFIGAKHES